MDLFSVCLFLLYIDFLVLRVTPDSSYPDSRPKCEEIQVPMCRGIGYNMTSMPNQFHHERQDEAGLEAHQFWPLVEIKCSEDLQFFLCSIYTPICMEDYYESLPACRSVCERAKSGCAPVMKQYGFPWPESMDCHNFPPYGLPDHLCMDMKEGASMLTTSSPIPPVLLPTSSSPSPPLPSPTSSSPPLISTTSSLPKQTCLFSKQEQSKSILMINITAFSCFICSMLVVCTYLTDRSRFCYPERAIIFLSGCYVMVSTGFLIRYHLGHSTITCDGVKLRYSEHGAQSAHCITIFILIYFFGMSASLWWVILTLAWFLSASLKWTTEAIDSYSWYFHAIAWGIPAIKSTLAIFTWAVDAEPLAGICLVGNLNPHHLMHFIIAPLCVYLVIGIIFLLAGLISLMQIRQAIRKQVRQINDQMGLVKLMVRIIVFSVLYIVPTLVVIICNLYQYSHGSIWEANYNCPCSASRLDRTYVTIHLFKYVMFLVVGITTCFWILSGKTLESWWDCLAKKLCCCSGITAPSPRGQLIGSTGGGSSQYIVNSQRSYKQINHIAQLSVSEQPHRKISLSHV